MKGREVVDIRFKGFRFLSFDDLLKQVCIEMDRLDNNAAPAEWEDDSSSDEGFCEWLGEVLGDDTRTLMMEKNLPPASYAALLNETFIWSQAYPDADFEKEFCRRLSMHIQTEDLLRAKGMEVEYYPEWRRFGEGE